MESENKSNDQKEKRKIYVTGKIQDLNKAEVRYVVEQLGFKWSTTISNLTLLVIGKNPGQNKIESADRLNIRILGWDEFVKEYDFEVQKESKQEIIQDNNIPSQISELITKTRNKKSQTRLIAYTKLIKFEEEYITEFLVKALTDELGTIRKLALKELKNRIPEKLPYLLFDLFNHHNDYVVQDSVKALLREKYPDKALHLTQALEIKKIGISLNKVFEEILKLSPPNLDKILVKTVKNNIFKASEKAFELLKERKYPKLEEIALEAIFNTFNSKYHTYLESKGYQKQILEKALKEYDSAEKSKKYMIIGKLAKYHYDERAMNLLERESNSSDKSIKSHAQHNKERAAIFKKIDPYLKLIQSVKDEDKIEGYTQIVKELGEDSFNYVKDGIITEETNVRIAIIKLLAPYASKYNISSFLKRFVNDRDGEVRESVRRILYSKAKEVEEKVDKAVKLIEDLRSSTETTKTEDSEITKKKTIIELGKMVGKKSVDSLVKFLKDENATIRGNTAQALGEIGDTKAIKPLEELLETEKNDYVKQGIEKALQQLRKK